MNDARFTSELYDGEQLLWVGKSEDFPVLDSTMKKPIFTRLILTVVGFIVVLALYIYVAAATTTAISPVIIAVLALIFLYVGVLPWVDRRTIRKRRLYAVTDRRVLVRAGGNSMYSLNKAGLNMRECPADAKGCTTILFGAATNRPDRKARITTIASLRDDAGEHIIGLCFYNVANTPELQAALKA